MNVPSRSLRAEWHDLALGAALAFTLLAVCGCPTPIKTTVSVDVAPEKHTWFAITPSSRHPLGLPSADGKMNCQSCHPATAKTFTEVTCTNCHAHGESLTARLHGTVTNYTYGDGNACYSCHKPTDDTRFDHAGIADNCRMCHDAGADFAVLPRPNFKHPETRGSDCAACHNTSDWSRATGAPNAHDPAHDMTLDVLLPTFAGTSIVSLAAQTQMLPMIMNHGSTDVPTGIFDDCTNCHAHAKDAVYFPGALHASLAQLGLAQPAACGSCHLDTMPAGFVGPLATNPARVPASGEMRHEAVAWENDRPTSDRLVTTNCGVCHRSSMGSSLNATAANTGSGSNNGGGASGAVTWATPRSGAGSTVQFHAPLAAASLAQPASCLDCHASSRPSGVLDSGNAALPKGVTFDHVNATSDCASCHAGGSAPGFTSWRQGKFHLAASSGPSTCLPCHAGERPKSDAGWTSTTYKSSPFDYGTSASGSTHGNGQDCVQCHAGPGTGAWGGTQTWVGGHFTHGPGTHSEDTCAACHSTQRPDLQPGTTAAAMASTLGFDHAANGTGECLGCHASTVAANRYVNYENPSTHKLPGGDWKGGLAYPGSTVTSSIDQFISITETKLIRDPADATLVRGSTTITDTLYNGMLHVSTALPAALAAGPTKTPDYSKCWHCHTNSNGTVTAFSNGQYHGALTNFRATPGGPVTPLPQPTGQCRDCHSAMVPDGIVEAPTDPTLWPMDHAATLATPIMIGTATVNGVPDLDCSVCHTDPGGTWSAGGFHYLIPSTAVASDCVACHYATMADPAADTVSGTAYAMKHLSSQLGAQACPTCHTGAKAARAVLPATFQLWQPATFHATASAQPAACMDCHLVSQPSAGTPTQSSVSYALRAGATSTNTVQWMNHGSPVVAGRDCVVCHAADAQRTVTAFSSSTSLHRPGVPVRTCQECHGLTNGGGGVAGTRNNLPVALTSSSVPTSASAATGIAAGTLSQISHADVNVTSHDCGYCHTQPGSSTASGVAGQEWAQARFHASFNTASALVANGATGRCSNCHMNVNPKASYTAFSHASFSDTPGTTDCAGCHRYPGTGSATSPNWLGATAGAN